MACCEKRQENPFWIWCSTSDSCWLCTSFLSKALTEDRVLLEAEWRCFRQAFGETPHTNLLRCALQVCSGHGGKQEQNSQCSQQPRTDWKRYLWAQRINSELNKRKWRKLEGIYVRAAVCVHLLLVLTLTLWAFLLAFTITSLHHGPSV